MRIAALFLILTFVAAAPTLRAQPTIPSGASTQMPPPTTASLPAPVTPEEHACQVHYPPDAVRHHHEGTTLLSFDVTAQGAVKDVVVKTSSGHAELDDASIKCVEQWTYTPPAQNSSLADLHKEVTVNWRLGGFPPEIGQAFAAAANACTQKAQVSKDALAMASGATVAEIQFYKNDEPAVVIDQSSGSDALDKVFASCLASVPPSIQMHPPFKMSFKVTFSWRPSAAAATSTSQASSNAPVSPPTKQGN